MLRLIQSQATPATVISLEGKLTAPWLPELLKTVATARGHGTVRLDLAGLSFVDRDGAAVLRRLRADGIELTGASHFVAELLATPDQLD
jgi:ABC-type transporter Mla MlaB component